MLMSLLDKPLGSTFLPTSRSSPFLQPMDMFDIFDQMGSFVSTPPSTSTMPRMSIDVKETPTAYELMADVPGMTKNDVSRFFFLRDENSKL